MVDDETFQLQATACGGPEDTITLVYNGEMLGSGAFGEVFEATLKKTGEEVAVKTSNITRTGETNEVEILKELKHCNIVKMLYHFRRQYGEDATREFIVMERLPSTLHDLYDRGDIIPTFEIKLYMYQLIRALAYLHARDICHRDVKPTNILIDARNGSLKLCDFGLSKILLGGENKVVGSRYYCAPEMLLKFTNYSTIVDMWSAGCILVELSKGGRGLFGSAWDDVEQMMMIIEMFGTPTQEQFQGFVPSVTFDLPIKPAKSWPEVFYPSRTTESTMSLCSRLLCYSPAARLPPHDALAHEFFDELRLYPERKLRNGNEVPPLFNFQPNEFPGDFDRLIPSFMRRANGDSVASAPNGHRRSSSESNNDWCCCFKLLRDRCRFR